MTKIISFNTRDADRHSLSYGTQILMIMSGVGKEKNIFWDTGKQFHLVISEYAILCS